MTKRSKESQGEPHVIQGDKEKPIGDFISDVARGVKEVEGQLSKLEAKNNFKYLLHTYGFTFGLFFLMCSRGYDPIIRFVNWLIQIINSQPGG